MIFQNIKIVNEDFDIEENMNVVAKDDRICYVGKEAPSREIANEPGQRLIDGMGRLLMPAFYNTHCHIPMTLLRGYGEGLPLQQWLNERIFPFEAKFSPESKYWGARLGAIELMKSGCVSISDMYFDLVRYGQAIREAGMKANLCNCLVSFDDNESYKDNSAYRDTVDLMEWLKDFADDRIIADASIHSEYSTREKSIREAADFARENGMRMQIHVSETESEHLECIKRHGMTPVKYMEKCGLLDVPAILAHCVWLDDEDIEIMISKGAIMSHNISSNLKLGSGIAPLKRYYDSGMNITIGTDGASSNNVLNMLKEMQLAAKVCRGAARDANAIPPKEILRIATVNGALAQGRKDCGLIREGCRADMVMLDLTSENMTPDYDTMANVVFAADTRDVLMTVCDGQVICENGKCTLIDEEETRAKAIESFNKTLENI